MGVSILFLIETGFLVLVSLLLFFAALRTRLLRRVSLLIATGFFIAVTLQHLLHVLSGGGVSGARLAQLDAGLSFVGALFFLIASLANTKSVSARITEVGRVLDRISRGEFDTEIAPEMLRGDDELGDMMQSFNRLLTSFKLVVAGRDENMVADIQRVQAELDMEQKQVSDLFRSMPIPYYFVDADGIHREVNEAGAELLGYTRDELIGMQYDTMLTEDSQQAAAEAIAALHEDDPREVIETTISIRTKEGDIVPEQVRMSPVWTGDEIEGFHIVILETDG